jgi:multidrug efflux pump subunit AcrA (membrane-fusion protein)
VREVFVGPGDTVVTGDVLAELDMTALDGLITFTKDTLEFNEAMWKNSNAQSDAAIARSELGGMSALADEMKTQLSFDKKSQFIERERLNDKIGRLEKSRVNYIITAPFDGTVTHVEQIAPGMFPMPRSTFIWLSDLNNMTVQSSDDSLRSGILYASLVTADFGFGEVNTERLQYTTSETLAFRQKKIDPPVRFAPVEGNTFPADRRILIRVYGSTRENVLILIPNAVHDDTVVEDGMPRHSYFVYLDEGGARVRRDIEVGLKSETAVEILSGLEEGDKVYVEEN